MSKISQFFLNLKKFILALTVFVGLWLCGGIAFTYLTFAEEPQAPTSDAIVVLTGGAQRVETAFQLLLNNKAKNLLISGVYEGNSLEDLVQATGLSDIQKNQILKHCCVELDFNAHTTAQNATESIKWITDNGFKSAIIVTSDYHIIRANLHFKRLSPQDVQLYYYGIATRQNIFDHNYWQNLFTEYHKSMVTAVYWLVSFSRNQIKVS